MQITKDTFIGEVISHCPETAEIFLEYGMQCVMCGAAAWESISEGALSHGLNEEEINTLVQKIQKLLKNKQNITVENNETITKLQTCLPIQEKNIEKILTLFQKTEYDLFELWLDNLSPDQIPTIIKSCPKPLICVCKGKTEKGTFTGTEAQRIKILEKALKAGVDYLDIGFHSGEKAIQKLIDNKGKSKIIISYHDWEKTEKLNTMIKTIEKISSYQPDIIKYVSTANSFEDNIQIFQLAEYLKNKNKKFIIMAMGPKGKFSRIFTSFLGSLWMYAPEVLHKNSAPGQITKDELKQFWDILKS